MSTLAINIVLAVWYVITYKEISFMKSIGNSSEIKEKLQLVKNGAPVMVAYLCSTLILTLDRQFVSVLFDTKSYAIYAFAYTMLSLITTALAAVSTVIYPNLKRIDATILAQKYTDLNSVVLVIASGGLMIYFPLNWFINWFIPKYYESLIIFRIVLPGVIISSVITVVMQNYYVALNKGREFFKKTVITLVLSFASNVIAYNLFKTTIAISLASIVVMFIWYILSESYFILEYKVSWKKNIAYLLIILLFFYIVSGINNVFIGFLIYVFGYVLISLMLYKRIIANLISIKNKNSCNNYN